MKRSLHSKKLSEETEKKNLVPIINNSFQKIPNLINKLITFCKKNYQKVPPFFYIFLLFIWLFLLLYLIFKCATVINDESFELTSKLFLYPFAYTVLMLIFWGLAFFTSDSISYRRLQKKSYSLNFWFVKSQNNSAYNILCALQDNEIFSNYFKDLFNKINQDFKEKAFTENISINNYYFETYNDLITIFKDLDNEVLHFIKSVVTNPEEENKNDNYVILVGQVMSGGFLLLTSKYGFEYILELSTRIMGLIMIFIGLSTIIIALAFLFISFRAKNREQCAKKFLILMLQLTDNLS